MSLYLQCPNSSCLKQTRRCRSHDQFALRFSGSESTIRSNVFCADTDAVSWSDDFLRRFGATSSSSCFSSSEEKRTLESCSLRQSGSSVVMAAADLGEAAPDSWLPLAIDPDFNSSSLTLGSSDSSELSITVIASASFLRFRLLEE